MMTNRRKKKNLKKKPVEEHR